MGRARDVGRRVANNARVGAKVNTEGVRTLTTAFDSLLSKLKQVRAELNGINSAAANTPGMAGGATGAATSNPNLSKFGSMVSGFMNMGRVGVGLGAVAGWAGVNMVGNRFDRNMAESIPISQNNMLLSSMYSSFKYGGMEMQRLNALGAMAGTRQQAAAAQSIALGFGQTAQNSMAYLQNTVAPMVQAYGGTINSQQAAAMGSTFLNATTMRRARAFGIAPGMQAGKVANPLETARGYITNFEQRYKVKLNEIDFANLRNPNSTLRFNFQQMYLLSDEALDMIAQAGMQNQTFANKYGRNINFSSQQDLSAIGLSTNRLGLKAFSLMSTVGRREARFFRGQEGAMVGHMDIEEKIQNTLSDVESAFGGVIGKLYEFEKVITVVSAALGLFGLAGGGGGGVIGGMLGLGRMGGMLGRGGGVAGGAGAAGAGVPGVPGVAGVGGGAGLMSRLGTMGGVAALAGGAYLAQSAGGRTGAGGLALSTAGAGAAAGVGTMLLTGSMTTPLAPLAAAAVASYGAYKYFKGKDKRAVASGAADALTMSDADLIKSIGDYQKNRSGSAGPKQRGRFDVFAMRRGALVAAMLDEVNNETDLFANMKGSDAQKIGDLIAFFSSDKVKSDFKLVMKEGELASLLPKILSNKASSDIYKHFFGNVTNPFSFTPINTDEAKGLVLTPQEVISGGKKSGDPYPEGGDGVEDKANAKGATWQNIDARLKPRLLNLFRASGGRVWLGNGWRSSEQQRQMFLSRYVQDPNGDVSYQGKKWKRVRGAPAAPPGSSMHEIGLAADLEGDLNWVQKNAGRFGLKTFANVNNEPWHVQPSELPNSRAKYEKGGGGTMSDAGTGVLGDSGSSGGGGTGGGPPASSGAAYSIAAAMAMSNKGGGGGFGGAASSSTSGSMLGGVATGGGPLSIQDVVKVAYGAGFRGQDLVNMVAVAMRESSGNPMAHNTNAKTGDNSYGLWQINMLGNMGPQRAKMFGISDYNQLLDPATNARAAYMMYQQSGLNPWGGYKGATGLQNTNVSAAAEAVKSLGLGGGGGDPMGGGGVGSIVMHNTFNLRASGNLNYDANQLAGAVLDKVKTGTAMLTRRSD